MNAASPSTEPWDRSTLRVMITSVCPAARIAKIDALTASVRSESASMKRGSSAAVTAIRIASATTIPSSRMRKIRSVSRRAPAPSTAALSAVAWTLMPRPRRRGRWRGG